MIPKQCTDMGICSSPYVQVSNNSNYNISPNDSFQKGQLHLNISQKKQKNSKLATDFTNSWCFKGANFNAIPCDSFTSFHRSIKHHLQCFTLAHTLMFLQDVKEINLQTIICLPKNMALMKHP